MVFYAEPATHSKEWKKKKSIMPDTRVEPRTANPDCIGDRHYNSCVTGPPIRLEDAKRDGFRAPEKTRVPPYLFSTMNSNLSVLFAFC